VHIEDPFSPNEIKNPAIRNATNAKPALPNASIITLVLQYMYNPPETFVQISLTRRIGARQGEVSSNITRHAHEQRLNS